MYATSVLPSLVESFVFFFSSVALNWNHISFECVINSDVDSAYSVSCISIFFCCVLLFHALKCMLTDEGDWLCVRNSSDNGLCAKKKNLCKIDLSQRTIVKSSKYFSTVHGIFVHIPWLYLILLANTFSFVQ